MSNQYRELLLADPMSQDLGMNKCHKCDDLAEDYHKGRRVWYCRRHDPDKKERQYKKKKNEKRRQKWSEIR